MNQTATDTSWWRNATWSDLLNKAVSRDPDEREHAVLESRRRVEEALATCGADTRDLGRLVQRICDEMRYDNDRKRGVFTAIAIRNRAVHGKSDSKVPSPNECLSAVTEYQLFLHVIATRMLGLAGASAPAQTGRVASKGLRLHPKVQAVVNRYVLATDDEDALLDSTYTLGEVEFEGFRSAIWGLATANVFEEASTQAQQLHALLFFEQADYIRKPQRQPRFAELKRQYGERRGLPVARSSSK